jgi:hypothetical protein
MTSITMNGGTPLRPDGATGFFDGGSLAFSSISRTLEFSS